MSICNGKIIVSESTEAHNRDADRGQLSKYNRNFIIAFHARNNQHRVIFFLFIAC